MSPKYSDKTLLVVDSGLFTHVAVELAKHFSKTLYFSEWAAAFPEGKRALIGSGLDNIERRLDLWSAVEEADLVVCPDVVTASVATHIREMGKPVFGSCNDAAELELGRWGMRKVLKDLELPTTDAARVVGTEDLAAYLKEHQDIFVKHGRYRGDLETHPHHTWQTSEEWMMELNHQLGPRRKEAEFIAEQKLEGVEAAIDSWVVDGDPPPVVMWGYEEKDSGYIGEVVKYEQAPAILRKVGETFRPLLRKYRHRGWAVFESRVTDESIPYVIDPCMRAGSPPSELQMLIYENWGEIAYEAANGIIAEPKARGKYGAMLILNSQVAAKNFLSVNIPDEFKDNVKLHNHCRIEGIDYVVPIGIPECGAVCGFGDTADSAKQMALGAAEAVVAEGLEYDLHAFEAIEEAMEKGKKNGIA